MTAGDVENGRVSVKEILDETMTATLYYTPNSPYGRIARVCLRRAGLAGRVTEREARTRAENTDYFNVTPLARVPYFEDGTIRLGDTREICVHFDRQSETETLFPEETEETQFLRHVVTGLLDGVAVWLRENGRPEGQKSHTVMEYEAHRAAKILRWLAPRWTALEDASYGRIVLACTLDIAGMRGLAEGWEALAPELLEWSQAQARDPAMQQTAPLPL